MNMRQNTLKSYIELAEKLIEELPINDYDSEDLKVEIEVGRHILEASILNHELALDSVLVNTYSSIKNEIIYYLIDYFNLKEKEEEDE